MSIRTRLPDGSYVVVPTDDPKAAAAAAQKHWINRQKSTPRSAWQTAGDFLGDMVDNVTPNWGDEIAAIPDAIGAVATGKPVGPAFRRGQEEFKAHQANYDKNHPNLAWGSTILGTGAGVLLPEAKVLGLGSRALKGASWGRKAVQAAKTGAVYGAVSGAGEGDTITDRATNAGVNALIGGAGGATISSLAHGAPAAGRWARQNLPGVDRAASAVENGANRLARVPAALLGRPRQPLPVVPSKSEQYAHRILGEDMATGNISHGPGMPTVPASPAAVADELTSRQAMGVPAMIGDTTQALRDRTGWASRGMGPGQQLVRERLDARKAAEGARIRQHVQETFPSTDDPIRAIEDLKTQAKTAAAPLYEQAYQQPVYRTPPIQAIEQTPAFRDALPQAYRNIQNQIDERTGLPKDPHAMGFRYFEGDPNGLPPTVPHFKLPERGYVAMDNGLSTEGYDQVTRAMSDAGRSAAHVNPVTGKIENTTNSVHTNARAKDLRSHLMEQNDPYRQAVQGYGDDMAMADGFNSGRDIGKLTGPEIAAQGRAMPDFAHQAWTTGAGTAMADAASTHGSKYPWGDTASHVRQMIGDPSKQQALSEVSGNTGGVRNLLDRLEYEHQGNLNWKGVNGNSATAARQAMDADMATQLSVPVSPNGWKSKLIDYVARQVHPQFQREVKDHVARIVTSSDASTVDQVMQEIAAQADRDRNFADLMHRAGKRTSAVYGMKLASPYPDQEDQ